MSLLIAFPGQATQRADMFNCLKANAFGKDWLLASSDALALNLFDEQVVADYCFKSYYGQCFITLLSLGLFYTIQPAFINKIILAGYSLGAVSAFGASARLPLETVYQLTKIRAQYMAHVAQLNADTNGSGLVVLKGRIDLTTVNSLCKTHQCYLAIINAADHMVVGGTNAQLFQLKTHALFLGVNQVLTLPVNVPAHTPLLETASGMFLNTLNRLSNCKLHEPILSALEGTLVTSTASLLPLLAAEISTTLDWDRTLKGAVEYGINSFLALSNDKALTTMFTYHHPGIAAYNISSFSSLDKLIDFILKKSR